MTLSVIIQPLSSIWWICILATTVFIIAFLMFARKVPHHRQNYLMVFLGLTQILREVWRQCYLNNLGLWDSADSLPLHLCGIASIVSAIMMFYPKQLGFEFLALLGVPGAIHSFLTPELSHAETIYQYIEYYVSHGGIILITLYLGIIKKYRVRPKSWIVVFGLAQILLIFVSIMNQLLGANYMYICERPTAPNPLIIGEWPWYILGFEIAGFIHIILFYLGIKKFQSSDD